MTERHPSLLWPGRRPVPLPRGDWVPLAAVYVLAAAVRWPMLHARPYTAEASHFVVARDLWRNELHIRSMYDHLPAEDFSWFFFARPLLSVAMWPAAQLGWTAYHAWFILLAALAPVLAALLLRQLGVHRMHAFGAALILCLHPVLVPWGAIVMPDTLVLLATLGALLAAHAGRLLPACILMLAAAWTKEVGAVTPLALGLLAWHRDADGTQGRVWPLSLGRWATPLLFVVLPLSVLPLLVAIQLPGAVVPGFRIGGEWGPTLERLFLNLWIAPFALLGLGTASTRRLAAVALAWVAFFVVFHHVTGKAVEVWYNVVPATLVLLAAAATVSAWHGPPAQAGHAMPASRRDAAARRAPAAAAAALVALLLLVQVAVPQVHPVNRAVATPVSGTGQWNLEEALRFEDVREDDLYTLLGRVPPGFDDAWMALDVDWSLVMHPLATSAAVVYKDYSGPEPMADEQVAWWASAIQARVQAGFVYHTANAFNEAIRDAYAPCAATVGRYTLVLPASCDDRTAALVEAYRQRRDGDGGAGATEQASSEPPVAPR